MAQWRRATQSFRKIYLSLYWNGCVWEGVGDQTELQCIDTHSYGHNSVSFSFSWAAQPGPGSPASLGHVPHSSIFSATAQSGAWEPILLGAGFLYRILSPTDWTSCAPSYIIVRRPPLLVGVTNCTHSTHPHSDIPRPDAPVIYIGVFLILTAWLGWRSIYNTSSGPGKVVVTSQNNTKSKTAMSDQKPPFIFNNYPLLKLLATSPLINLSPTQTQKRHQVTTFVVFYVLFCLPSFACTSSLHGFTWLPAWKYMTMCDISWLRAAMFFLVKKIYLARRAFALRWVAIFHYILPPLFYNDSFGF